MAKRTAERQLTQLNQHDDEDSDYQGSNFQKADEGELAKRVIRKPKSRLRSVNAATESPKASFSGFAGFGATSSNASEGSGSEQPKSSFKGFSFGQSASASEKDAQAVGASSAKSGGFGSSGFGSSGFGSAATPAFGSGGFGAKPSVASDKPAGFSFGAKPSTTTDKPSGFSFGTQSSGFTFGKPAAEPEKPTTLDTDKPTASSFSIGAFKPPSATAPSTASTGMFSKTSAQPSFKSGFVPPTGATQPKAEPKVEPAKSASDDEFYRHIRGLNASIQKKITDAIAVNAFVDLTPLLEQYRKHWKQVTEDFMPDIGAVDTAKPAVTEPVVSKAAVTEPVVSKAAVTEPVVSKAAETAPVVSKAAEAAPKKSSMFASLSPPTQSSKPAEPTKFSFGAQSATLATSPKPAETKFAFGAQSTSSSTSPKPASGSPGGFSFNFNKPTPTDAPDAAKKPFSFGFGKPVDTKPAFSFGLNKPAQSTDAEPKTPTDDAQSDDEPDTARAPTTAGEEGETTVHKVRGKVYMWDSEKKAFKDLGVGNLRINTWETDQGDKRARVLCRQETTEKITLNASMFAKMMVEHKGNDKNVGLLAVVDAKPTRFMFRVKTTGEASDLKKALDTVIASL
ncbi:hypothetical protein IW147_000055 [Coemansia sp. RSA 720]|nr:hypothetical protein IW147_000055 [Coemansia sp. RSA 720]